MKRSLAGRTLRHGRRKGRVTRPALGRDISGKYPGKRRNVGFFDNLSNDLCLGIKNPVGLSARNLRYSLAFYQLYSYRQQGAADNGNDALLPQITEGDGGERYLQQVVADNVVSDLMKVPWGHHIVIIGKSKGDRDKVRVNVGGEDFWPDLIFYHLKSRRYLVIELKAVNFKPEHIGQLGFYMVAVDRQLKNEWDAPTVGLVLCRDGNKTVIEYALSVTDKPMGVAKYRLTQKTPKELSSMKRAVARLGTVVDATIADAERQSANKKGTLK